MSPGTINIAVLHGQAAYCDTLCDFIADQVGFRIVGSANATQDALAMLERVERTHVLVVDLESAGDGAAELMSSVRALSPGTGILLLVQGQTPAQLQELVARGAGGYLAYARLEADTAAALRTIGMGRRYLPAAEVGAT